MRPSLIRLQQVASSSFYPIRRGPPRYTMRRHPSPQNLPSEPHTSDPPNYETWTREELITHIKELTATQSSITTSTSTSSSSSHPRPSSSAAQPPPAQSTSESDPNPKKKAKKQRPRREFNFSAYTTRKIRGRRRFRPSKPSSSLRLLKRDLLILSTDLTGVDGNGVEGRIAASVLPGRWSVCTCAARLGRRRR